MKTKRRQRASETYTVNATYLEMTAPPPSGENKDTGFIIFMIGLLLTAAGAVIALFASSAVKRRIELEGGDPVQEMAQPLLWITDNYLAVFIAVSLVTVLALPLMDARSASR